MSILSNNYANVNENATTFSQGFTSTVIPITRHTLPEPSSNIQAAAGKVTPFSAKLIGGTKRNRKNKMSRVYRRMKSRTKRLRSHKKSRKHTSTHRRRRHMRGGQYKQFMSNVAYTPSYSLGGQLNPSMSALANPPPYTLLNNSSK
jgi:hypothetical protein